MKHKWVTRVLLIAKVLALTYLVVDVVHYLQVRRTPGILNSVLYEYAYESKELSYLRWFLTAFFVLIATSRVQLKYQVSYYFVFSATIALLFFRVRAFHLVGGSVAFNLFFLEIVAVLSLLIALRLLLELNNRVKVFTLFFSIIVVVLIFQISKDFELAMKVF